MSPRRVGTIAACALAILLAASCAMPPPPDRVALVYGVSLYVGSTEGAYPNLTYANDDADAMAQQYTDQGWTVVKRTDADATKANITADIQSLTGFDGIVTFYYSGHGTSYDGTSYILPRDSIDASNVYLSLAFSPAELFDAFRNAGLKHVIVILDNCNSGGFVDSGATTDGVPPLFGPNETPDGSINYPLYVTALGDAIGAYASYASYGNVIVLSAAGAEDFSWESSIYGHGIFTYFVLRSPGYADADGDGLVTTSELFSYAAKSIQANWNATNQDYYSDGQYADFMPHVTGSPREYALFRSTP